MDTERAAETFRPVKRGRLHLVPPHPKMPDPPPFWTWHGKEARERERRLTPHPVITVGLWPLVCLHAVIFDAVAALRRGRDERSVGGH